METDRTRHSLATTLEEELFHADWKVEAGLKSKLSWVMTINKSQGQGFKRNVGVHLPRPVFAHG